MARLREKQFAHPHEHLEYAGAGHPYDVEATRAALQEALDAGGPAVLIARRECALLPEVRRDYKPLQVDRKRCVACWACLRTGCPALRKSDETYAKNKRQKSDIDPLQCTGCELCAQVCPKNAILFRAQLYGPDEATGLEREES